MSLDRTRSVLRQAPSFSGVAIVAALLLSLPWLLPNADYSSGRTTPQLQPSPVVRPELARTRPHYQPTQFTYYVIESEETAASQRASIDPASGEVVVIATYADEVRLNRLLSDLRFDWIELGPPAIKVIDLRQR